MPLLDIAIAQSSFQNYLGYPRVQRFINGKVSNYYLLQCQERWASYQRLFQIPGNMNYSIGHKKKSHPIFLIKAVATLEPKCRDEKKESNVVSFAVESIASTADVELPIEDSEEVDEREKLRRMRISKANKGNTPWNKGRKHSPETLQRIRERTRLAMQNPKVKMKLASMGHAQSEKTREKIAAGVRMGWQRRREKLMLQETCLFDWQNLIAETARKGFNDEEELQWDSYKIINEQLQQDWLNSVEYRKTMPKPRGSKRAPKSLEQRRKIAEAIAAKWADPEYRSKVQSGIAKYHGTPEGAERKTRKRPSGEARAPRTPKKKVSEVDKYTTDEIKMRLQQPPKLKKRNVPKYKDPLASYKLEMLKSIRAQRVASETKKNEALERAKLLIAEAEKAAKALEVAATKSAVAQASLIETRKLIAEAIQSIESIENRDSSQDDESSALQTYAENEEHLALDANQDYHKRLNGITSVQSGVDHDPDFDLYKLTMLSEMDMKYTSPSGYDMPKLDLGNFLGDKLNDSVEVKNQQHPEPNGAIRLNGIASHNGALMLSHEQTPSAAKAVTRKWVRGRLVEVAEGECE